MKSKKGWINRVERSRPAISSPASLDPRWRRQLRDMASVGSLFPMTPEIDPNLLQDPLFQELMAEGLAMQDRFSAEPVYARTGRGFLRSEGVAELQRLKVTEGLPAAPSSTG